MITGYVAYQGAQQGAVKRDRQLAVQLVDWFAENEDQVASDADAQQVVAGLTGVISTGEEPESPGTYAPALRAARHWFEQVAAQHNETEASNSSESVALPSHFADPQEGVALLRELNRRFE